MSKITEASTSTKPDDTQLAVQNEIMRRILCDAGLILSAYARLVQQAGHPFRHPPGVSDLRARIDSTLFPDTRRG